MAMQLAAAYSYFIDYGIYFQLTTTQNICRAILSYLGQYHRADKVCIKLRNAYGDPTHSNDLSTVRVETDCGALNRLG